MTLREKPFERQLAEVMLTARDAIPANTLERAGVLVADSVAISLAASRWSDAAIAAARAATLGSGGGSAHLLGSAVTTSPAAAAFANAAFAHALDFDDTHDLARLHTTTVVLPAALAAGELCDAPGDRVLRGVVLGAEVMCRLGLAARPTATSPAAMWFLTQLVGYVGAAVSAAVALDLDAEGTASAISFAYSQVAGGKQAAVASGSEGRSIYPAFASSGGVMAAMLASTGLRGPLSSIDGPTGLWQAYLREDFDSDSKSALLAIGESQWEFDAIVAKPWPSCRLAHPYIAAAMTLPTLTAPIESITLSVNASVARLCRPVGERRRPKTLADAGFSVPYMTALALVRGDVRLSDFTPELLSDSRVHEMVDLIEFEDSLPDGPGNPPGRITVTAAGGTHVLEGDAYPPLSDTEIRDKAVASLSTSGFTGDADELWILATSLAASNTRNFMDEVTRWCGDNERND